MKEIYLNAAGHGLPDTRVLQRMIDHLTLEARIGPVAATEQVEAELGGVRERAIRLLGARSGAVGFDVGTLSAWRAHVSALPLAGKRLLVAPHEWGENIVLLRELASIHGATVDILPPLDLDTPDLSPWHEAIDEDVAALFLPMVTSVAGLRYPVAEIGALPRPAGMQVIVDAAQALGQIDVDVSQLGCDAVFATTRKWVRGPHQTALFWTADPTSATRIERLVTNPTLRLGLGVALEDLEARTVEATVRLLRERTQWIRNHAAALSLETLSSEASGTGTVTLAIPDPCADAVAEALVANRIIAKWPTPAKDEPHSALDLPGKRPLRLAPHLPTTPEEIDHAFAVIAGAL